MPNKKTSFIGSGNPRDYFSEGVRRVPRMRAATASDKIRDWMLSLQDNPAVQALGLMPQGGAQSAMTVFHGTGAPKFTQFDWDKIGSGANGQAFGKGIYTAGKKLDALDYFRSLKLPVKGGGYRGGLVTADLPDEYASRMLRWNSPLYEQPSEVQNLLTHTAPGTKDSFFDLLTRNLRRESFGTARPTSPGSLRGSDLYLGMSPLAKGREPLGSIMEQARIPGIKYLNDTNTNRMIATPKDFNYVSFKNHLPKVLDYWDWPELAKRGLVY